MNQQRYGVVSFDFPCVTWSRSRRYDGKGPPPIRGDKGNDLWGLEDLSVKDRTAVDEGNKLLEILVQLIHYCLKKNVVVIMENPLT